MMELGYEFSNKSLLQQALTHSSYVYEKKLGHAACNERLEFLGDAVLELLASDLLYKRFDGLTEGELSKSRANMVCEPSLAAQARRLGLGMSLRLGRGEASCGGADKDSILSDALEAVIGAIYLDGGLEEARAFIDRFHDFENDYGAIDDPKSHLQEVLQKTSRSPVHYNIIEETGPAHLKEFTATVAHEGRILGVGIGKSKKDAERNAAIKALDHL